MHLTLRQRAMLAFIWSYQQTQGFPPTQRDIQAAMLYVSVSSVDHQLSALEEKGLLTRARNVARGNVLTEPGRALGARLAGEAYGAAS